MLSASRGVLHLNKVINHRNRCIFEDEVRKSVRKVVCSRQTLECKTAGLDKGGRGKI